MGRVIVVGSYAVGLTIQTDAFPVPGETRRGWGYAEGPGGKGSNQAIGAARLGTEAVLVAYLGDDRFGHDALRMYAEEGVDASRVRLVPGATTGVGFIVIDRAGQNIIVLDPGANTLLDVEAVEAIAPEVRADDVVLSQLEIRPEAALAAMAVGRRAGARTILNPAPAAHLPSDLGSVDVLTPNQSELRILVGRRPDDPADDAMLANTLLKRGVGTVVVTRGSDGALTVDRDGVVPVPAPQVDVVDSTGAGDAFNAALAAGLARGEPLLDAVRSAVVAGALACTRLGVVPSLPTGEELSEALRR
ncbi:MAG TPA: ribokinase [Candidatus Limnocylindrales bacterium]|nr:ribokinase [Candidatus Limnocylindrales bacterium]